MIGVIANSRRRTALAAAGIVSLVAAFVVAGPLAWPAHAATFAVADEQEYRQALTDCKNIAEPCEIVITESFTISAADGDPLHQGSCL